MTSRKVLIFEKEGGIWGSFLRDYLAESGARVEVVTDVLSAPGAFDRISPVILFVDPGFLSKILLQKIKVRHTIDPHFRTFLLGPAGSSPEPSLFSACFPAAPEVSDLDKRFVETLPLPGVIHLLVVDDEPEIGAMVRDYFENRRAPAFEIECAPQGLEALEAIKRKRPDVILLDIKMPVMDGREFYARLKRDGTEIPVIVFFDSISVEELAGMRELGELAVIEKGSRESSMGALMFLIKKIVYFRAS